MLKITMIRHGRTAGSDTGKYIGLTDEPLLEDEKKQLSMLKFPDAEAVYTSPLSRCVQTAQILYPNIPMTVISEFAECDYGAFEGRTYQELAKDPAYKEWVESNEIISYPDGESRKVFQDRTLTGFNKMIIDAVNKRRNNIAMVVHGGTIMTLLGLYGFPPQKYADWAIDNGEGYRVRLAPELFINSEDVNAEIIVDGKIVRAEN